MHRANRLDEAETLFRAVLAVDPNHADALNSLGTIAFQRSRLAEAVQLIDRAISIRSDQPIYQNNLSAAYHALGRFNDAAASAKAALALQPHQLEAHINLGLAYQGAKQWQQAETVFRHVEQQWPHDARGPQSLGDCFREQGKTAEAINAYRESLTRAPNDGRVHFALGTLLLTSEDPGAAEPHLKRAVELLPDALPALINFGSCLAQLGRERDALRLYMRGLQIAPNDALLKNKIGQALLGCWEHREAVKWFSTTLQSFPDNAAAACGLADAYREGQRPEDAIPLYERSLRLGAAFSAYRGLADAYRDLSQFEKADDTIRKAVELYPNRAEAHVRLGMALAFGGELEKAISEFRTALRIQPHFARAHAELARLLKSRLSSDEQAAIEAALKRQASDEDLAAMHFALAQVEDARDHFERAAEHLRQANALAKSYLDTHGRQYNVAAMSRRVERLTATFTPDYFKRTAGFGDPSERPVFVIGMPRSGTTLVEQILASHPQVFGAGELPFVHRSLLRLPAELGLGVDAKGTIEELKYLEQLTPSAAQACARWYLDRIRELDGVAERVVDKAPENYLLLGWVVTMFPKARIIHCRRDLRDVALSCWMTEFRAVNWANDMHHLASRIREYRTLMEHWKVTLSAPMLEMNYEQLVADQESESRKLITWLGLKWDPACLKFHQTRRAVTTPSATQVRQPIYSRSVGRWRHYVNDLRPLIDELGLEMT